MQKCKGYIIAIQLIQVCTLVTYRVHVMKGYTNKKSKVRTHNYKKEGATCVCFSSALRELSYTTYGMRYAVTTFILHRKGGRQTFQLTIFFDQPLIVETQVKLLMHDTIVVGQLICRAQRATSWMRKKDSSVFF